MDRESWRARQRFCGRFVEVVVALSEKDRAKRATKTAAMLPPGTTVRTLVQGTGHFRVTVPVVVALGVFVVAFAIALAKGVVLIPGVLLVLFVAGEARPGRDLVVTDQGLAIFHRSGLTGRPRKVIALLPPAPVYAPTTSGSVTLALGPENIKLNRKEFDRLAAAMGSPQSVSTPSDSYDWAPSAAPTDWTPPAHPGPY
jgi:hypothetical protein